MSLRPETLAPASAGTRLEAVLAAAMPPVTLAAPLQATAAAPPPVFQLDDDDEFDEIGAALSYAHDLISTGEPPSGAAAPAAPKTSTFDDKPLVDGITSRNKASQHAADAIRLLSQMLVSAKDQRVASEAKISALETSVKALQDKTRDVASGTALKALDGRVKALEAQVATALKGVEGEGQSLEGLRVELAALKAEVKQNKETKEALAAIKAQLQKMPTEANMKKITDAMAKYAEFDKVYKEVLAAKGSVVTTAADTKSDVVVKSGTGSVPKPIPKQTEMNVDELYASLMSQHRQSLL